MYFLYIRWAIAALNYNLEFKVYTHAGMHIYIYIYIYIYMGEVCVCVCVCVWECVCIYIYILTQIGSNMYVHYIWVCMCVWWVYMFASKYMKFSPFLLEWRLKWDTPSLRLFLSVSVSLSLSIYICVCVCVCLSYTHTYIKCILHPPELQNWRHNTWYS